MVIGQAGPDTMVSRNAWATYETFELCGENESRFRTLYRPIGVGKFKEPLMMVDSISEIAAEGHEVSACVGFEPQRAIMKLM